MLDPVLGQYKKAFVVVRCAYQGEVYSRCVVLDSHWFTTFEFIITAQDRRAGLFTAEELPRGMCRIPYDWRGDPELAHAVARFAPQNDTWITPIDDHYLPLYYPTINLWKY